MRSLLICLLFFASLTAQAAPDVQLYKNQFVFTEKSGRLTHCERVGPRMLRKLAVYKTCEKFSVSSGPTDGTTAKCVKGEAEASYIYGSRRECKAARAKMPGSAKAAAKEETGANTEGGTETDGAAAAAE